MDTNYDSWLGRLGHLNVSQSKFRGPAPHQPLMLLVIIDMAEAGSLKPTVPYDLELTTRFRDLWPIVLPRRQNAPDIRMPFYALGGSHDSVWTTHDANGRNAHGKSGVQCANLNEDLFKLLQNPKFRHAAISLLITEYFTPAEQIALFSRFNIKVPNTAEIADLRKNSEVYKKQQELGRSAKFKTEVVFHYYFACALTGYRFESNVCTFVQAAHIHPLKKRGPDVIENGLALSPDAHWLFDKGLWAIDDRLQVHVARKHFQDSSPFGRSLIDFDRKNLYFHPDSKLRPDGKHLDWHFTNVFLGEP